MLKEFKLSCQRTATEESAATVLHKKLEEVVAGIRDLQSENATLRKEFETSSKALVETSVRLANDLDEMHGYLGKKTSDCDAFRATVVGLKIGSEL